MNALDALLSGVQPQANKAATQAAQAAVDNLAQKPFSVVISVDDATKLWLSVLVACGLIGWKLANR